VRSLRRARRPLLALVVLVIALVVGYALKAADSRDGGGTGSSAPRPVALSSLPTQAAETVRLIDRGGPFPYPHNDGVVFHNDEHRLPSEPDGYYREYTVPTPGSDDRGARRIITGRNGAFYWTGDHYETFRRIEVAK
jgi:ribonuclease T1